MRFRGREAAHQQLGLAVLKRVADELKDEVKLEKAPALEGRALSMILIPSAQTTQKPDRTEKAAQKSEETADQSVEDLTNAQT